MWCNFLMWISWEILPSYPNGSNEAKVALMCMLLVP